MLLPLTLSWQQQQHTREQRSSSALASPSRSATIKRPVSTLPTCTQQTRPHEKDKLAAASVPHSRQDCGCQTLCCYCLQSCHASSSTPPEQPLRYPPDTASLAAAAHVLPCAISAWCP